MQTSLKGYSLLRQSQPLILASASPRRRDLLHTLGLEFSIVQADVPEEILKGESPADFACRLAADKANAVAGQHEAVWVLAADTIVVQEDGVILGKPGDIPEACAMLRSLAGCRHIVMTAYTLLNGKQEVSLNRLDQSSVTLMPLTEEMISAYVATGEPMDKAGSYALQGIGGAFVHSIAGAHSTVIGLPLHLVLTDLLDLGIIGMQTP